MPAPGLTHQSFLPAPELTLQSQHQCWAAVKLQTKMIVLRQLGTLAVLDLADIDHKHHSKDLLWATELGTIQSTGSTPKRTMLTNHAESQQDQAATLPDNHPKMLDMAVQVHCQHTEEWMLLEE
jgi:hypothetical protein